MEVKIKTEKEVRPGPCTLSGDTSSPSAPASSPSTLTVTHAKDTTMTHTMDSMQTRLEPNRRQDVFTDEKSPSKETPAIDLRIIKKERIEGEMETQANQRSPSREPNGYHHPSSRLLEQKAQSPREKAENDSVAFVSLTTTSEDGRSGSRSGDEDKIALNRPRFSESIESYPYRVPIVYPIHSPPIDYRSINNGRSPSPNGYRLEEGDRSTSPMVNQRQLYEETHWPSMGNDDPVKPEEKHPSGYNGCSLARTSTPRRNSPLNSSDREGIKEGLSSPKSATQSSFNSNAERATFSRRRGKNPERVSTVEDDKEEESLWKQVQRYRHRKRPALGKLHPTQEETIFMQYNEIRERRHREGRIITRAGRPVMALCNAVREPSLTPPSDNGVEQVDSKLQVLTRVPEPSITPKASDIDAYVSQEGRARIVDLPQAKGMANNCVTEPSQNTPSSVKRPPSYNSISIDSHPGSAFDGTAERRKTPSEQLEGHTTPAHCDYQGYASSPRTHACTGQQTPHYHDMHGIDARVMEVRALGARPVVHGAMDCRTNLPYEDCCRNLPSYQHRPIHPLQRFHFGDDSCYDSSCHDNRRRRLSPCGHHCCHHKRSRRTSVDAADEYNDDNDENNHWRYSPKEKRSRSDNDSSRDVSDLYRRDDQTHPTQNGSQPFSPSSSDSRDNESIENGQSQDFQPESESQLYENGHISQESSSRLNNDERRFSQVSPYPVGEREPDDDDVICHVNGLFSLPGYRETKYDITRGELKRRTEPPETLTRVEMISYVRQAKTSGRILLDTNGITTSNRSHPTILSRVCEREAQVLACGIHKMNLEYIPLKKLVQMCVDMYKSRGCDGCQDCRLKLRRRVVDVEITRNMLEELQNVIQEASAEGFLDSFELASHTFGTMSLVNHIKLVDEYHKLLLLALEKE